MLDNSFNLKSQLQGKKIKYRCSLFLVVLCPIIVLCLLFSNKEYIVYIEMPLVWLLSSLDRNGGELMLESGKKKTK